MTSTSPVMSQLLNSMPGAARTDITGDVDVMLLARREIGHAEVIHRQANRCPSSVLS